MSYTGSERVVGDLGDTIIVHARLQQAQRKQNNYYEHIAWQQRRMDVVVSGKVVSIERVVPKSNDTRSILDLLSRRAS